MTGTREVLDQVGPIPVDVVAPRRIKINGYQVKPLFGSGARVARNENNSWNQEVMPFTESAFPYATISYTYIGSIWMLPLFGGNANHVMVMAFMNSMTGYHPTDPWSDDNYHLNVGIMNWRYAGSTTGMCWYGYPGISLAADHGLSHEITGYALAHEMGHAFGLEHAPSKGANSYFLGVHINRVDNNYPYGGGGMAGGWGYADIRDKSLKHFFSEDAHTVDNAFQAHWDVMAYLWDKSPSYKTNRFSDYNQRKMLNALKLNQTNQASCSPQEPDDPFSDLPVIPGTNIKVFGPEQAHAAEEAWYIETGARSIYAVDPGKMDSVPLDFDASAITVADDGRVIMPRFDPKDVPVPAEFAYHVGLAPEGDGGGDMIHLQGDGRIIDIGDGDVDDDGDEPPYMIVTRLPRLLGLNVER